MPRGHVWKMMSNILTEMTSENSSRNLPNKLFNSDFHHHHFLALCFNLCGTKQQLFNVRYDVVEEYLQGVQKNAKLSRTIKNNKQPRLADYSFDFERPKCAINLFFTHFSRSRSIQCINKLGEKKTTPV